MNDVECVNGVADDTNTGVSLVRSYNLIKVMVILQSNLHRLSIQSTFFLFIVEGIHIMYIIVL